MTFSIALLALTYLLAGFLLAATTLAVACPRRPLLGVSQNWGLQLWWLALLGALPALWLRDWVALAICAAIAGYWSLRLFGTPPSDAAQDGARLLRIVFANLLYANTDHARIARMIDAAAPDVVALCETTPEARAALGALAARYPHALDTCEPNGLYGLVILSRFPLTERSRGIGEDAAPRHLAADLEIEGARIALLAIHPANPIRPDLAGRIPAEFEAVARLCRQLAGDLILIGDCNAAGWSHWLRQLERDTDLVNDRGLRPSWPVWLPRPLRLPLDHVWVRGRLSLQSARLGRRFGSDHLPLIAEIGRRRE